MTPQGRFLSEKIRPLAEKMRNLDYEIQAVLVEWYSSKSALIDNDSTEYDDGRVDEGVPAVTGAAITNAVAQMAAYKALMDKAGVRDVIQAPCVRPVKVD